MFRRQAYYYASAAFLIVWLVYTVAVFNKPYVGFEIENVNGQWIVTYSDPQGEGYKSGVRVGDLVIKVNNDVPYKYRPVQIWSEVEGASTIEVRRLGQSNDQMINILRFPVLQSALSDIPMAILGFVFWLLGFVTWFRRPFLVQARALFWLNLLLGLAVSMASASSHDLPLAKELEIITFSAVPIFLIKFFSVFSNKSPKWINQWIRRMLTLMFAIILIITVLQSAGIVQFLNPLRKLLLATLGIGILFALGNLGSSLKGRKDKTKKNQIVILILSLVLGFSPFLLLTAIPIIFDF